MNNQHRMADLADSCVKCGLCSTVCPTYQFTSNEAESPRGRIALLDGLAQGHLSANEIAPHIDSCLGCLSCEQACPSQVKYHELLHLGKATLFENRQHGQNKKNATWLLLLLEKLNRYKITTRVLYAALRFAQLSGLTKLIDLFLASTRNRLLKKIHRINQLQPKLPAFSLHTHQKTQDDTEDKLLLVSGCIANLFERQTLSDAITLFSALKVHTTLYDKACCGAYALKNGNVQDFNQQQEHLMMAFKQRNYDIVTALSSTCSTTLGYYANHPLSSQTHCFTSMNEKVMELHALLLKKLTQLNYNFPLPSEKILVHIPCSLRNNSKGQPSFKALMDHVFKGHVEYTTSTNCCGAAGDYTLTHPEVSDSLTELLLDEVCEKKPDIILTNNIGCFIQIQKSLRQRNLNTTLLHPVSFILKQLKTNDIM